MQRIALTLLVTAVLSLLKELQCFLPATPALPTRPTRNQQLSMVGSVKELSFEDIAQRLNLRVFGQKTTYRTFELETYDRDTFLSTKTVPVNRVGGIGLQLVEILNNGDGSGLVVVEGIVEGSNAEAAGAFKVGDVLRAVDSPDGGMSAELLGKDYDSVIDTLGMFSDYDSLKLTVQRLQVRGEVQLEVVGPDGATLGEYVAYSGKGLVLRDVLLEAKQRVYESKAENINCGGQGVCGTCAVAVLEGGNLINDRVRMENAGIKQQGYPGNYRWSCQTILGRDPAVGGKLKIQLRPQTVSQEQVKSPAAAESST